MAWNRPDENATKRKTAPKFGRGALAGVIVAALAAGALYWLMGGDPKPAKKAAETAKKPAQIVEATSSNSNMIKESKSRPKPKSVSEALANVGDGPEPVEIEKAETPVDLSKYNNVKRTFSSGVEQLMSWIFTTECGDLPMPIPPIGEEDKENIVSILISKNEIFDDDSERTKECKETVELAKKEMLKYLHDGGDPDKFLQYYYKQLKKAYEWRNDAIDQAMELHAADPSMTAEFVNKINEKFAEEGIKKIELEEVTE